MRPPWIVQEVTYASFPSQVKKKNVLSTWKLATMSHSQCPPAKQMAHICLEMLPGSVMGWSVDEVAAYVRGFAEFEDRAIEYADKMAKERIDGEALVELTDHDLREEMEMALGHRKKFLKHVAELSAVEHQNLPSDRCCRSMLSKSARKFPPPKPRSPLRWMIS